MSTTMNRHARRADKHEVALPPRTEQQEGDR
jgi:hypothetical protein